MRTRPQGEGEVLYWKREAEVRGGSVGLVKGQAELSSPVDGELGPGEDMRRKWI